MPANINIFLIILLFFFTFCQTYVRVRQVKVAPYKIYGNVPSSDRMLGKIQPYRIRMIKYLSDTLLYNKYPLDKSGKLPGLGVLVSESLLMMADSLWGKDDFVVWINRGGLRSEIPAGYLTVGHIYELMPFDNVVCMKHISKEEFEKNRDVLVEKNFVLYDRNQSEPGQLMKKMKNGGKIILSDFLMLGGDGISLEKENQKFSTVYVRDAIIMYLKKARQKSDTLIISKKL